MAVVLAVVFWGSLLGLFYTYLGYPALISVIVRWRYFRDADSPAVPDAEDRLPAVTVLVVAYNAAAHLDERIANILASDYPSDRLDILVASDGSTDDSVRVAGDWNDDRVRVVDFASRRGKAAALVDAVGVVSSPVIVFTDATTHFDRNSLRRLTRHFENPKVGLVAGNLTMIDQHGVEKESIYWKLEKAVRQNESRLGITLGASGAIYAVRRSMFVAPRQPIINDDLVLPMLVRLTHQCQVVRDPSAQAYASSTGGLSAEFSRRVRIGAGAFQCLPVLRELMSWNHRWQAAAFVSHKLMRWVCPFMMVAVFVSNLALLSAPLYQFLLLMQMSAYAAAGYGLIASKQGTLWKASRIATSFVVLNLALGIGICRWLVRPNRVVWNPTPRPSWSQMAGPGRNVDVQPATKRKAA